MPQAYKLIGIVLLLFGSLQSALACEDLAGRTNEEIRTCLNDFAKGLLDGSVKLKDSSTLPQLFESELTEMIDSYRLPGGAGAIMSRKGQARVIPLAEQYRIRIPAQAQSLDSSMAPCFEFQNEDGDGWQPIQRALIRLAKAQILEAAFFLKSYHARSLGRSNSALFQIHDVEICGGGNLPQNPTYENRTLRVFTKNGNLVDLALRTAVGRKPAVTTALEIEKAWTSGAVPFGIDLNQAEQLYLHLFQGSMAMIHDGVMNLWRVLNPIGRVRTEMRFEMEKAFSTQQDLTAPTKKGILVELIEMLGFRLPTLSRLGHGFSEGEAERVLRSWKRDVQDPQLTNSVLEQIALYSVASGTTAQTVDERKTFGTIVVRNNKQIVVDARFLMAGDDLGVKEHLDKDQLLPGPNVSQTLKGWMIGLLVAVDLSDQVVVNAAIPVGIAKLISRVTLERALKGIEKQRQLERVPK